MKKVLFFVFFLMLPVYGAEIFKGFSIGGDAVFYFQSANPDKNVFPPAQKGWGNVLNLEANYSFKGLKFYARFHNGNGTGIDRVFGDYFFANANTLGDDNTDGDYDLKLLEGYFSFSLFNDKLEIVAGKTEPLFFIGQNEFANDEASMFIGKPLVNDVFVDSENLYAPILGFTYSFRNVEFSGFVQSIERHKVFYNGVSWEIDETGTHSFGEKLFTGFQVNFKTNFKGLKGNYRFYFYNNSHPHFPFGFNLNDPNLKPEIENADGYGLSFDQYVSENLGVFVKYGKAKKKVYAFDEYFALGFVKTGVFSEKDKILFGYSVISPVKSSGFGKEYHYETQYGYEFSQNYLLSADFQLLKNSYLNSEIDLFVFTLRLTMFF